MFLEASHIEMYFTSNQNKYATRVHEVIITEYEGPQSCDNSLISFCIYDKRGADVHAVKYIVVFV